MKGCGCHLALITLLSVMVHVKHSYASPSMKGSVPVQKEFYPYIGFGYDPFFWEKKDVFENPSRKLSDTAGQDKEQIVMTSPFMAIRPSFPTPLLLNRFGVNSMFNPFTGNRFVNQVIANPMSIQAFQDPRLYSLGVATTTTVARGDPLVLLEKGQDQTGQQKRKLTTDDMKTVEEKKKAGKKTKKLNQ